MKDDQSRFSLQSAPTIPAAGLEEEADGFLHGTKTRFAIAAELLFELISQRYERDATIITSNLPLDGWIDPKTRLTRPALPLPSITPARS